jgi:hypothetical protein
VIHIPQMSKSERLLWRAPDRMLDLRTGNRYDDDISHGSEWPASRSIRAPVLAAALLRPDNPGRESVPVLRLAGVRITGRLELGGASLARGLRLDQCYFEESPELADARTRTIRIVDSFVPGINALNIQIDGQLDLNRSVVVGRLRLVMAHITGEFTMNGTTLVNPSDWTLFAGGLTVDGGFFCRHGFTSQGSMRLVGANFNGGVFLDRAVLTAGGKDALVADNLKVEGRMICDDLTADGALRLPGARIAGQLSWEGAIVRSQGTIGLDFRRLVAEELILTPAEPVCGMVNLENARLSVLCDDPMTWPLDLRLDGLVYDSLVSLTKREDEDREVQQYISDSADASVAITPSKDRLIWLHRNSAGYRPQPFEQLAAFYRSVGHDDEARKVLLDKQRFRRSTQKLGGKAWGYLLDWTVGYGYRPWLAAAWLAALVTTGSLVFAWWPPSPVNSAAALNFNSLVYTINLLLPVGQFVQPDQWNPGGAERWFTYTLVGLGWLLATTIITGVTRVLNRS